MTDGNAGTRTVIYRLQCAALPNGCWSALAIDGPANIDIDALDQAVPEDRRIDDLIRTAGWWRDHGRWVCGNHQPHTTAATEERWIEVSD